jgi:hypothetical protein
LSIPNNFEKAFFLVRDENSGPLKRGSISKQDAIEVHFNPTSLQYTISSTIKDPGQGNQNKQYVSQSTAKLTMDLVFDTTHKGEDVRIYTDKVGKLMKPDEKKNNAPPIVLFAWGNFMFQGMVESFKETIEFFSANGVPLRSIVNIGMSQQDKVFEDMDTSQFQSAEPDALQLPTGSNLDATAAASLGGNARAGRGIATLNGLESMRFTGGASLTVGGTVELKPPVAFATGGFSAGAGLGVSGGAGIGLSAGGGIGVSGGAGIGGGASAGAGATASFGASASAGVSASEGAFAGLRASGSAELSASVDTSRLIPRSDSSSLSTDSGASFSVGGRATVEGSASLSADVGANADLRSQIQFDQG